MKKIEHLKLYQDTKKGVQYPPSTLEITEKINEIIDVINDIRSSDTKDIKDDGVIRCPECGTEMKWDGLVRTSLPPVYYHECPKCGYSNYYRTHNKDSEYTISL